MKAVHSWVMTKEAMRERVLEWLTPYRGGRGNGVKTLVNLKIYAS